MSVQPPSIPDYQLLRCIGRGGYGEVWLGRGVTGIHRAVKIVHRSSFSEDRPYEREFSGIKKFQAVSHAQENLVSILHVGRNDEAGYFFYVMELADAAGAVSPFRPPGSDLDTGSYQSGTLKQLLRSRGRLPVAECMAIARGLARAIEHLHANGLIHRDIKPSNIIFVNGVPKLADIGLVAGMDESRSFVGTEGFVPPDGPGTVSADLFALGRLLYEMATGRDRLDYPKLPEDLDELPDRRALLEFNEVMLKAGDPERSRRYESAGELVRDLLLLEAGKSVRRLRLLETRFALALRTATVAVAISLLALAAWLWATFQAREAKQNLAEAERHRSKAEVALRDVLLNQVRVNRQSGWAGQRVETLRMLREAPAMTNSLAFRNEAIACLALPDVLPLRSIDLSRETRVALDRNLTRYATNDGDGAIYVRSADDDRLLHFLPSPGAGLYGLGFSEDDQKIGASYLSRRFVVWDLANFPAPTNDFVPPAWTDLPEETRPKRVLLPAGAFAGAGFSGGREFAVQCRGGRIHFVNPTNGVESRVLTNNASVSPIRFNADGSKFAGARSNECLVYRTDDGARLFNLPHPGLVTSVAWHPDGRRLATTCFDFKVRLWDASTGQQLSGFEDHEAEAVNVEFDATGTLMVSTSWDDTTRLWAPESARSLVRVRGGGNQVRLAADGNRLSYVSWDHRRLVLSTVLPGRELTSFERFSGIYGLTFSADARFVVAGSAAGLHVWQWPHFSPVSTLPVRECGIASFSPDGASLFAAGRGVATEWKFQADDEQGILRVGLACELAEVTPSHVAQFNPSADATMGCLLTESRTRLLRRASNGWMMAKSLPGKAHLAVFSVDHQWLALSRGSRRIDLLDREGNAVTNVECVTAQAARFSPDGRWLAVATRSNYTAYRVGTWEPGPVVPREDSSLQREAIAFSRNGRLAAFRTADRELTLVDSDSWQTVATLGIPLHTTSIACSADGSRLGVATEKLGVQVWDLALVRAGLTAMGLDWDPPGTGPSPAPAVPPKLRPVISGPVKSRTLDR